MEFRELFSRFGAEVIGIELDAIGEREVDEILTALDRHALLLFRKQCLDDRALFELSSCFGNLQQSARRISHGPVHSHVANLTNLRGPAGEVLGYPDNTTDFWHSDQEFREHPATLASLYCLLPTASGGETSFASTNLANLGELPVAMTELAELWADYHPAPTHDNAPQVTVRHPVLLHNPRWNRRTVYVSQNTLRFIPLESERSAALKAELLERILAPANIYSHRWRMGDFILYDNTQLLHRREAFEGLRWIKATKIYADPNRFVVPAGRLADAAH